MKMNQDVSILICTCDAYYDVLPIFFHFFIKAWPDCSYPIYINTEKKVYIDDRIQTMSLISDNEEDSWSERFRKAIQRIDTKYVIVILDDFFLLDKVNADAIRKCVRYMENDPSIACFNFRQVKNIQEEESTQYKGFRRRKPYNDYWVNLLPCLWNKKKLQSLLSPYESAWQFEWFGTERAKLRQWNFMELSPNYPPIFKFNISMVDGFGICQGRWMRNNIALFESEGIKVDFSKRGFFEPKFIMTEVEVPYRTFKDRIIYFVHGGLDKDSLINGEIRMSVSEQLMRFIKYPGFAKMCLKKKFKYLFNSDRGEKIVMWDGKLT